MSKKRRAPHPDQDSEHLESEFKKIKVSTSPHWSSQTWVISTRTQPSPIVQEMESVESSYKAMNGILKQLHLERKHGP